MKKIKLYELFAGVGFTAMALKEIADFERGAVAEWFIPSIVSYAHIHIGKEKIQEETNRLLEWKKENDISDDDFKQRIVKQIIRKELSTDGKKPAEEPSLLKKNINWLLGVFVCDRLINNLGSITRVRGIDLSLDEETSRRALMTYSFPCQDLSIAGKRAGMREGTRSGLLWEVQRILEELGADKPAVLLMENVIQVHSKKNETDWNKWLEFLESIGYENFWKDMNAKDYGVPQNRNRTFMVSFRKDLKIKKFKFPDKTGLDKTLEHLIDAAVDEKYYITNAQLDTRIESSFNQAKNIVQEKDYVDTILARDYKDPKLILVGNLKSHPYNKMHESSRRVYHPKGIAPTINTVGGGNLEPKVAIIDDTYRSRKARKYTKVAPSIRANQQGFKVKANHRFYEQALEVLNNSNAEVGDIIDAFNKKLNKTGISPTITTRPEGLKTAILPVVENYRIRKLTPKECWRFMDATDEDFEKAREGLNKVLYNGKDSSRSQLYAQAGNGIVKAKLKAIFKNIIKYLNNA